MGHGIGKGDRVSTAQTVSIRGIPPSQSAMCMGFSSLKRAFARVTSDLSNSRRLPPPGGGQFKRAASRVTRRCHTGRPRDWPAKLSFAGAPHTMGPLPLGGTNALPPQRTRKHLQAHVLLTVAQIEAGRETTRVGKYSYEYPFFYFSSFVTS